MADLIQVRTFGFDAAVVKINKFGTVDADGLLSALAETVRRQTLQRFASKTAPDGSRWAPLKNPGRRRSSGDILVNSGQMRNSISSIVHGHTAEVGTNVFYAGFHHFGTRKMVSRRFLGVSASDAIELRQVAEAFLDRTTS